MSTIVGCFLVDVQGREGAISAVENNGQPSVVSENIAQAALLMLQTGRLICRILVRVIYRYKYISEQQREVDIVRVTYNAN